MKYKTATVLFIFLLSASILQASEIKLHFPHFSGQAYEWKIFQGKQKLTVRTGEIPSDGRVALTMPETYQDYRGMTRWLLKKGGGLDMIYTGKSFSVECLSDKPNSENIIYTGSKPFWINWERSITCCKYISRMKTSTKPPRLNRHTCVRHLNRSRQTVKTVHCMQPDSEK